MWWYYIMLCVKLCGYGTRVFVLGDILVGVTLIRFPARVSLHRACGQHIRTYPSAERYIGDKNMNRVACAHSHTPSN